MPSILQRRQMYADDNNDDNGSWWYSSTGFAVHYAIIGGVVCLLLLYFTFGYAHARRRLARGQAPLAYHRWMVRRIYPYGGNNHYAGFQQPHYGMAPQQENVNPNAYPMQGYVQPPPVYNARDGPPAYQVPDGASKVAPSQSVRPVNEDPAWNADGQAIAMPPAARQA